MFDVVLNFLLSALLIIVAAIALIALRLFVTWLFIKLVFKLGKDKLLKVNSVVNCGFYFILNCICDNAEEYRVYYWVGNDDANPNFRDKRILTKCCGSIAAFSEIVYDKSNDYV